MPELPEVVTVVRTLEKLINQAKIIDVRVHWDNIIEGDIVNFINIMRGQTFLGFSQRGKFLIFELTEGYLISHLRMEGKFYVLEAPLVDMKHVHVEFMLEDGRKLYYHDTRKFGRLAYVRDLNQHPGLNRLGFEVWDKECTPQYLLDHSKRRSIPIKTLLLDQSIISGIGNIYVNEILFACKISPLRPAHQLETKDAVKILKETDRILSEAIAQGGTSIKSYTSQLGVTGLFQQSLQVHGRVSETCFNCQTEISKISIGGRGTYYCTNCQEL